MLAVAERRQWLDRELEALGSPNSRDLRITDDEILHNVSDQSLLNLALWRGPIATGRADA